MEKFLAGLKVYRRGKFVGIAICIGNKKGFVGLTIYDKKGINGLMAGLPRINKNCEVEKVCGIDSINED